MNNTIILEKNQTKEYHLEQAKKYRQGMLLVTPAKVKADYLAKAEMHEQIAHDLACVVVEDTPPSPPPSLPPKEKSETKNQSPFAKVLTYALAGTPPPKEDPEPPKEKSEDILTPAYFVKVHSKLAPLILKTKDANLTRAFAIWLVVRSIGKAWMYQERVIKLVVKETGKDERTIKRWIKAGVGELWVKGWRKGKRTISLKGKNKVLDSYGLTVPGRVLAVPIGDLLTPKLNHLRACLRNVFFNREKKWASRKIIEQETGIKPRTQNNYDKQTEIKPIEILGYWPWIDRKGKLHRVKSLPNRYLQKYGNMYKQHKTKRYNLRTVGNNAISDPDKGRAVKVDGTQGRIMHDTVPDAVRKAEEMAKKGKEGVTIGIMGKSKNRKYLMAKVIAPFNPYKELELGGVS